VGGDGSGACEEESEGEGSEEQQDGNWSEQEEASQAAAEAGVAAVAEEAYRGPEAAEEAGSEEVDWEDADEDGCEIVEEELTAAEVAAPGAEEQAALHAWLEQRGLGKYAELFERAGEQGVRQF